jgi:hypothetical protein
MYPNKYYIPTNKMPNDNRFIGGGFLAPFLLGGITGGLLAPAFYPRPIYPVPVYNQYPVYPVPYNQNQYIYYN